MTESHTSGPHSSEVKSGGGQPIAIRHIPMKPVPVNQAEPGVDGSARNSSPLFIRRRVDVDVETTRHRDNETTRHRDIENAFRDWDHRLEVSGIKGRRQRAQPSMTKHLDGAEPEDRSRGVRSEAFNGRPAVEELEVIRRDELKKVDPVDESLDEISIRRPVYVDCAETGQRMFRMEFDLDGFTRDAISVTLCGQRLEIHAIQEELDAGRKSTNEFSRRVRLPADVIGERLTCAFADGKILAEAPVSPAVHHSLPTPSGLPSRCRSPRNASPASAATSRPHSSELVQNVPLVTEKPDGCKSVALTVDVGRIFRSDDVAVRLKNPSKLVVTAERSDATEVSRLSASLVREFDLPCRVVAATLAAGLTADGLLRITAQVDGDGQAS